jgi:hypothetical protein
MMFESPCTPQFLASIFFPCERSFDDTEPFLDKLPYFAFECYIVGGCLFVWFFNWIMVYLGLAWLQKEILGIR